MGVGNLCTYVDAHPFFFPPPHAKLVINSCAFPKVGKRGSKKVTLRGEQIFIEKRFLHNAKKLSEKEKKSNSLNIAAVGVGKKRIRTSVSFR